MAQHAPILPGRFSPRFARAFAWYVRRLMRSRFHAVRILAGDTDALVAIERHDAPAIVLMNHAAWWDPLVAVLLGTRFMPTRTASAPMDVLQLRRFGFFRRLGLFGIDPEDPQAAPAFVDHVCARFAASRRETLWITPQGRFADVREPARVRAGAPLVAARTPEVAVVAVAVEYPFWQDARPEVCLAVRRVAPPDDVGDQRRMAMAWQRVMQEGLREAAARLATAVMARDARAFVTLLGDGAARVNPVYDAWLRLRGAHGAVVARPLVDGVAR